MTEQKEKKEFEEKLMVELEQFRKLPQEEYLKGLDKAKRSPEFEEALRAYKENLGIFIEELSATDDPSVIKQIATAKRSCTTELMAKGIPLFEAVRLDSRGEYRRYMNAYLSKTSRGVKYD